jgi:hypothetical protein
MARKKASPATKQPRNRHRLNLSLTAEQDAELRRRVPKGDRGAYCKDRIFSPWGLPDPLVEVGSRLLGRAAQAERLRKLLNKLETRADQELSIAIANGADADAEVFLDELLAKMRHTELLDAIGELRPLLGPIAEDAREVRQLIAGRREQSFPVPIISKRETD